MSNNHSEKLTVAQEKLLLAHLDGPQRVVGPGIFRFISLRRSGLIRFDEHPANQAVGTSTITELGIAKARGILTRQANALAPEAMA